MSQRIDWQLEMDRELTLVTHQARRDNSASHFAFVVPNAVLIAEALLIAGRVAADTRRYAEDVIRGRD